MAQKSQKSKFHWLVFFGRILILCICWGGGFSLLDEVGAMLRPAAFAAVPGSLSPRSKLQNIRRRTSAPSVLVDSDFELMPGVWATGEGLGHRMGAQGTQGFLGAQGFQGLYSGARHGAGAVRAGGVAGGGGDEGEAGVGLAGGIESKLPAAKPRRGSWPKRRASMPVSSFSFAHGARPTATVAMPTAS